MNRRKIAAMLGIFMGVSLLATGCAKTPESGLVKQKGKSAEKNYQEGAPLTGEDTADETQKESANGADALAESSADSADEQTEAKGDFAEQAEADYTEILRERLGAPERYQSEVTDATGKLQILTDAQVEIPNASKVSAIAVKQHPFDQEQLDLITETFFGDAVIYDGYRYDELTKADYQEQLEELKGYQAAGNLDPYDTGTDENGNYIYDLEQAIASAEEAYANAPEERILQEVQPQLGLEYTTGVGADAYTWVNEGFKGVAELPDGSRYDYDCDVYGGFPMQVKIRRREEQNEQGLYSRWMEYQALRAYHPELPDEEELKQKIGISLEDAKKIADEKVAALGFTDMDMNAWEYAVQYVEDARSPEAMGFDHMTNAGYLLHYTRKLNGMPSTYVMEYGGGSETMESETATWAYERLDFYVTKDGIDEVVFLNRYDIGETKTENLELLPFQDVMEIYEKMMLITNADVINHEKSRVYHINRIALGYSRIYEPSTDTFSGTLVPTWNFFGDFGNEWELEDGTEGDYVNAVQYQSYLTINAVDGSIIDLGLGY